MNYHTIRNMLLFFLIYSCQSDINKNIPKSDISLDVNKEIPVNEKTYLVEDIEEDCKKNVYFQMGNKCIATTVCDENYDDLLSKYKRLESCVASQIKNKEIIETKEQEQEQEIEEKKLICEDIDIEMDSECENTQECSIEINTDNYKQIGCDQNYLKKSLYRNLCDMDLISDSYINFKKNQNIICVELEDDKEQDLDEKSHDDWQKEDDFNDDDEIIVEEYEDDEIDVEKYEYDEIDVEKYEYDEEYENEEAYEEEYE